MSQGGRFPPFLSEGKPPKRVRKGSKDLTFCRVFRQKTCCDAAQTYPALLTIRKLGSTGEASRECLQLWELLECSICDPHVGVQPGPPLVCASFCDRVFKACTDAYFSMDTMTQVFMLPLKFYTISFITHAYIHTVSIYMYMYIMSTVMGLFYILYYNDRFTRNFISPYGFTSNLWIVSSAAGVFRPRQ